MHRDRPPDWVLTRRRAIGMQLRAARKAQGLTQLQLAQRINRDIKSISRWENGHRPPDLNDLLVLADALDISLGDLDR